MKLTIFNLLCLWLYPLFFLYLLFFYLSSHIINHVPLLWMVIMRHSMTSLIFVFTIFTYIVKMSGFSNLRREELYSLPQFNFWRFSFHLSAPFFILLDSYTYIDNCIFVDFNHWNGNNEIGTLAAMLALTLYICNQFVN